MKHEGSIDSSRARRGRRSSPSVLDVYGPGEYFGGGSGVTSGQMARGGSCRAVLSRLESLSGLDSFVA